MLIQIELRHFKCFELLKLPLAPLTLLAGVNASGKSTVLQALGLLHQTVKDAYWSSHLFLNGSVLRLGSASDVIDQVHGRRTCSITLIDRGVGDPTGERAAEHEDDPDWAEDLFYSWKFSGEPTDRSLRITGIRLDDDEWEGSPLHLEGLMPNETYYGTLPFRLEALSYLTAERLGPRDSYRLPDSEEDTDIGPAGENVASLLEAGRSTEVLPSLVLPGAPPTRLPQVQARMASFFPGCVLDVQQIPAANVITLGIRTSGDTPFHRPVHTGFGLTQVLPIVVAALSADRDALLLIENPEVHLHPAGQAQMGTFLAEVAAAGVQVLVESHSDHVLNGIRRAVKAGILEPSDSALHFFSPRSADASQVQTPAMDADGGLDFWPDGFFDQFDKDLSALAGWD
ncbi:MAG: DUF3696 domain-containing protein [Acidobacteriota bacterium]|nr:DUF3696 domain-containing protein [Acidobacteriota bacterium]